MKSKITLSAAMMVAAMGLAHADGLDPIAIRQVGMDLQNGTFGLIRSVVAAKGDVKTLEGPAKALARWAKTIPSVFPAGSDKGGNTKALPEVWSDRAGFEQIAEKMGAAALKLADAAKAGDADAVAAEAKAVGEQCGACHHDYRAK
jgi:cytochrome c556